MSRIPNPWRGKRRLILVRLIVNSFAQAGITLANGLLVKFAFDNLVRQAAVTTMTNTLLVTSGLFGTALGLAWLRVMERTDAEKMGQSYAYSVRMSLYRKLSLMSPRALQKRSQGGVALRFVGDLTSLRQWISFGMARLVVAITNLVAAVVALSWLSPQIAVAVGVVFTLGIAIAFYRGQNLQAVAQEARRHLSRLAGDINEKVAAIAVVQVCGQTQREKKRLIKRSRRLESAAVSRGFLAGQLRGISEATVAIASATVLLVGAREVSLGNITPGTIVAASSIVGFLLPPLRDLGRVQEYWHNSRVSRRKIQQFLDTPTLVKVVADAPDLEIKTGLLEFEEVSIAGTLDKLNAVAKPGQKIALVGTNGAGKSTLLALAARLLDPDSGAIYLDGQNIADYSLISLRRSLGMASPDLPLLRGSIGRNLRYRCHRASEAEIARVWQLCEIDALLAELPQGEQTRIAEGGKGLSSGQRQKISLARAILGNPPLLLLDEIDANLDTQATAICDRVIAQHQGTVLVITHRYQRLLEMDCIWYLENGKIREIGSPQKLLNSASLTAQFFASAEKDITNLK